jgi:hypothetical protein
MSTSKKQNRQGTIKCLVYPPFWNKITVEGERRCDRPHALPRRRRGLPFRHNRSSPLLSLAYRLHLPPILSCRPVCLLCCRPALTMCHCRRFHPLFLRLMSSDLATWPPNPLRPPPAAIGPRHDEPSQAVLESHHGPPSLAGPSPPATRSAPPCPDGGRL